ncbi:MAG: IS4 family transposase [Polyangia bacterium]
MPIRRPLVPSLAVELADADLGDARLNRRAALLAERLSERPAESFPKALDDAELEAAYRFFGNEQVTPEGILAPHIRQSARRASDAGRIVVAHDTTQFEFGGEVKRTGLGRLIKPSAQGFFGHFSFAISADGSRRPLGVVAVESVFRLKQSIGRGKWSPDKSLGESARWSRAVEKVEAALDDRVDAIHVMDREGDQYALLASLVAADRPFVIRSFQDRRLAGDDVERLRDAARAAKPILRRDVPLSPRKHIDGPKGQRHPARRQRIAKLSYAATTVEVQRPPTARSSNAKALSLNVIHVFEKRPPVGQPPVEWFLLTSLPIATGDDVAFAVDCYRARWTIEEFFKALKTGCQFEKRQLESAHSLLNALAILSQVAWRLLLLRHLARSDEATSPSHALTASQIGVLRAVARRPLPAKPTARDTMLAVAALGGHIKNNGDPGWIVLGRGMHDLLLLELGWRAREQEM